MMQRKADVRKRNARQNKRKRRDNGDCVDMLDTQKCLPLDHDNRVYIHELVVHAPHTPTFKISNRELTHSLNDLQNYLNDTLQMDIEIIVKKTSKLEMF